jgi:AcrR family transcriptional regulator
MNKKAKPPARSQGRAKATGKISSRVNGRDVLLQIMIDELNNVGESEVRLEIILERAQLSPSSLYHHFGNLRGLIEEAHVERYIREVYSNLDGLKKELEDIETKADFVRVVDVTLDALFAQDRMAPRFRRANALGSSYGHPEFAARLASVEREAIVGIVDVLKVAQYRGFIARTVDLEAFAGWLNATFSGSVAIDLMDDPSYRHRWAEMTRAATKYLLGIK